MLMTVLSSLFQLQALALSNRLGNKWNINIKNRSQSGTFTSYNKFEALVLKCVSVIRWSGYKSTIKRLWHGLRPTGNKWVERNRRGPSYTEVHLSSSANWTPQDPLWMIMPRYGELNGQKSMLSYVLFSYLRHNLLRGGLGVQHELPWWCIPVRSEPASQRWKPALNAEVTSLIPDDAL